MSTKPQGLGDEESKKYRVITEFVPRPNSRKDLFIAFERIISQGGVQKVVVELGKPIQVRRSVEVTEALPEESVDAEMDIYEKILDVELGQAAFSDPKNALRSLCSAFDSVTNKGHYPSAILVHQTRQLAEWLQIPVGGFLFGVEVQENKHVPDEVAVLVAVDKSDPDSVIYSVRIEMDVPSVRKHYETTRGEDAEQRPGGQSNGKDHGAVGPIAGGLSGQDKGGRPQERNKGGATQARRGSRNGS